MRCSPLARLLLLLGLFAAPPASAVPPEYQLVSLFDADDFLAPGLGFTVTGRVRLRDFVSSTELAIQVPGPTGGLGVPGFFHLGDGSFTDLPLVGSLTGNASFLLNEPAWYAAGRRAVGVVRFDDDPDRQATRFTAGSFDFLNADDSRLLFSVSSSRPGGTGGINDAGFVAGTRTLSSMNFQAVVYQPDGSAVQIGTPFTSSQAQSGHPGFAHSINNQNDVLLINGVTNGTIAVAMNLGQDGIVPLGPPTIPGAVFVRQTQLLDTGEVLAVYNPTSSSGLGFAALLGPTGVTLQTDPFDINSNVAGMNDLDQMFGFVGIGGSYSARYWDADSGWLALRDLIDPNDPDLANLGTIAPTGELFPNDSGEVVFMDSNGMVYLLTPAPLYTWILGSDGDFDDDLNWVSNTSLSTGVPGISTTLPDRVDISEPGSYTVSGVPQEVLKAVSLGNDDDNITLDMQGGTFETEELDVFGSVDLIDGVLEAGYNNFVSPPRLSVEIFGGGQLVLLGPTATLKAGFALDSVGPTTPNFEYGDLALVGLDAQLVVLGGKIEADGVATGFVPSGGIGEFDNILLAGAGGAIETIAYRAGVGAFSRSKLSVSGTAELRVRDRLALGIAADSAVDVTVEDNMSGIVGLQGDLFDTGPKDIIVGDAGTATLTLDNAVLQVGENLVLGQSAGGQGNLLLTNGANLFTSSTQVSEIIVGDAGNGVLQIDAGSSFASTLAIVDQTTLLTLGKSAGGFGVMDLDGGFSLTDTTAFVDLVIGDAGAGILTAVDGAQILTETFSMGIKAAQQSSQLHLDVGATLNVRDGFGARIGGGGDGLVLVDATSTFSVRRVNPLAPDEAQVASVGSGAIGGAGLLVFQTGSGDFDTLSIGELSAPPTNSTLTTLTRGRTGAVQVDAVSTLDATQILVGGDGLLSANRSTVTVGLDLVIGTGVGSLGALVEIVDSRLDVFGGSIQVGTVPADTLTSEFRVLQNSDVATQGIDARGGAAITIDDSQVTVAGNIFLGAFPPVQDPNGMVSTTVSGPNGILAAPFGTIQVGGDGTDCTCISILEISNGGIVVAPTLTVEQGGILLGNQGTVHGTAVVKPGGTVSPGLSPGRLTVDGDVTFETGSNLHIQIGGLTADTEHDVFEVLGDLTVDGNLTLEFVDGFAPQMADEIDFLSSGGTLNLAAQQVAIMNLAPGFLFDLASVSGGVRMTALNDAVFVPAPGAQASMLAAVFVLALLVRARRASMRSPIGLA